jgi:hypothetical protein
VAVAACGEAAPDPTTLLKQAQSTFNQVQTLHFVLTTAHLGTSSGLTVTQATGDVQRPDRLSAQATAIVSGFTANVQLIIIGQQQWITNPLTGQFEKTNQYGSFLTIFDPQQGIGAALVDMQQPSTPQDTSANGRPCWKIYGKAPTSDLAAIVGGSTATNQTVGVSVCIGKSDSELYTIEVDGVLTQGDTTQTTRTFTLSNFDQPVNIQPPAA